MTRKKETNIFLSSEDNAQLAHLFEQRQHVANQLHNSTNQEEAEVALAKISSTPEAIQMALLKALSIEHDSKAADILIALNKLSPHKNIRKEARRSLLRLEEAKVYPQWKPFMPHSPLIQIGTANPPRFWRGLVTQAREEGEVQLILCWEQGYDYAEASMMIFLLDFWEQGLKEFIIDNTNKRNVDAQIHHLHTQLPNVTLVDCKLAEARHLIEEALAVNTWRGTRPHKEFRHHLPTVNQLVLNATSIGEDRGLTFINPHLEADEVAATFVGAWALGDYGLTYDLLSSNSNIQDGLMRDEWIERHRSWANEAKPTRFELGYIREREANTQTIWLPTSFSGNRPGSHKEIEISWSLELRDTPLSGTLKEMALSTAINKETGRNWFWTSYTLVQEEHEWRIQQMSDEGAKAQGLSISELQKRIQAHDQRLQEILQRQDPNGTEAGEYAEEVVWRMTHTLFYDDALLVQLPLDSTVYGDACYRAMGLGMLERASVYLERIAHKFVEQRGAALMQLGTIQEALSEYFRERGMHDRAKRFFALAEASLYESLSIENTPAAHTLLAEMLLRQAERLDEAEAHLLQAKELITHTGDEMMIETEHINRLLESIAVLREELDKTQKH